eukprot:CAMPEP_0172803740 /NCGR_PEP_ID=MMETSP1075-20121228/4707_1 /TAXON_ID=2916 /ORGANISM="Ceratium fusus, Strain PA161109" /LENGTH=280 /DNA_ID=CAMNT_0013642215 /DNA_START=32 /DNA_END=871 /DNA_ORIENTATION=+
MPPPDEVAADEIRELCNRVDAAVQRMTDASAAHAAVAVGREAAVPVGREAEFENPLDMEGSESLGMGQMRPPPPPPPPDMMESFHRPPKPAELNELPWAPLLRTAWIEYCAATPANLREIPGFLKPVPPVATLYRNLYGNRPAGLRDAGRRGGAGGGTGGTGSSGGMAPAQHADPGPQPEAVRILMPKYGLTAGSVHRVLGATKLTWKLVGAKAVPFHHEGLGWERAPASDLQDAGVGEEQPVDPADIQAAAAAITQDDLAAALAVLGGQGYFNEEMGQA